MGPFLSKWYQFFSRFFGIKALWSVASVPTYTAKASLV